MRRNKESSHCTGFQFRVPDGGYDEVKTDKRVVPLKDVWELYTNVTRIESNNAPTWPTTNYAHTSQVSTVGLHTISVRYQRLALGRGVGSRRRSRHGLQATFGLQSPWMATAVPRTLEYILPGYGVLQSQSINQSINQSIFVYLMA